MSGFMLYTVVAEAPSQNKKTLYRGEDAGRRFIDELLKEQERVLALYQQDAGMKLTKEDHRDFAHAEQCCYCHKPFEEGEVKVRDHDHFTGKYRGAAHNGCNVKCRYPSFIPVVLHNLRGYDSHLILQNIDERIKEIVCIPNNEEKYMSFTLGKLRFIDSFQFMTCSLQKLCENLKTAGEDKFAHMKREFGDKSSLLLRKGVYPYEYMDGFEKFSETELRAITQS